MSSRLTPNQSPEPTWLGAADLRLSVLVRHVTVPTWLSFCPLYAEYNGVITRVFGLLVPYGPGTTIKNKLFSRQDAKTLRVSKRLGVFAPLREKRFGCDVTLEVTVFYFLYLRQQFMRRMFYSPIAVMAPMWYYQATHKED